MDWPGGASYGVARRSSCVAVDRGKSQSGVAGLGGQVVERRNLVRRVGEWRGGQGTSRRGFAWLGGATLTQSQLVCCYGSIRGSRSNPK